MRTITTTVYLFDELSDEAKKNAIERLHDINVEYPDWHEFVLLQAKEDLKAAGFLDPDIRYRGFWSQGDGASFTARVDLPVWLRGRRLARRYRAIVREADSVRVEITQAGHYSHEHTMGIAVRATGISGRADRHLQELEVQILEDARDRAYAIYRSLEREYEDLTGDEAVIETIRANEYEFTEDGRLAR